MKAVKIIACIAIAVVCVAYAAKTPFDVAGLKGFANKAVIVVETNGWYIIETTPADAAKTAITIEAIPAVDTDIAIVNGAKLIKTKKTAGVIENIAFVAVVPDAEFEPVLVFANGALVKMKGATIGTVLGNNTKLAFADSIENFATDGVAGKGGKVMSKVGDLGGPDAFLGDDLMGTVYKMIKAKANVNGTLEAMPAVDGKSKIQGVGGTVVNAAGGNWKTKGVTLVTP